MEADRGGRQYRGWGVVGKQYLSFSSLVIEDSLRSTGRSLSEPGVRAASGGRTQAGKARGLRCRRPHGSGGEEKAGGAPGLSFWAKTAPELNVGLPRPPKAPFERAAKEAKLVGRPKGSVGEKGMVRALSSQLQADTKN